MPIVPDTKNWTWVLERPCPECGVDVRSFPREELGRMIRENAERWEPVLAHPDVRIRPLDDVWSALEYGCHVSDVFLIYDSRLQMMLEHEDPAYPNWDQDATAIEERYDEQDPAEVVSVLRERAQRLARRFESIRGGDWERTGRRSDGARFTVESLGRYLIHDPMHHLHDVERGFARLKKR